MQRIKIILKLIALVLAVYFLLRVAFGIIYFSDSGISFSPYIRYFYWGLRMDFAALVYSNFIFLGYYFFIAPLIELIAGKTNFSREGGKTVRKEIGTNNYHLPALPPSLLLKVDHYLSVIIFSLVNLPFFALNFIDLVYFRYTLRRSTLDIFNILEDSMHSFGSLFAQYWFVLLIFVIVAIVFVYIAARIIGRQTIQPEKWYLRWLVPPVFLALCFWIARGGESRPIVPSTALLHADPAVQPLINNSTLNLFYSYLRTSTRLKRKDYFSSPQLDSIYAIRRQYPQQYGLEKKNVVLFMLESFNAGFLTPGPGKAKTPFFDSLMNKSMICTNAFANGFESVKGILGILGSMPPFLDEPLFLSNYSSVPFRGIGTLLKEEGYNTNFFLGAEYDHFNFAKLCRMVGIDHYYSENDYNQPRYDDGNWGIYDEYFFSYFADIISKKPQPFFSVLFNISSHPPFAIPPARKKEFTIPGQNPQLNSITYVDDCFARLFERMKNEPWFSNTIFIFSADHALLRDVNDKSRFYKACHIPLFIYDPQQPQGTVVTETVQQLDIIPTILDKLGYSKPFMSFGHSFKNGDSAASGFSICKMNEGYQLTMDSTITGFDEHSGKLLYHYNYRTDSLLANDLSASTDPAITSKLNLLKAIIQRFNNSLIDQKLFIK